MVPYTGIAIPEQKCGMKKHNINKHVFVIVNQKSRFAPWTKTVHMTPSQRSNEKGLILTEMGQVIYCLSELLTPLALCRSLRLPLSTLQWADAFRGANGMTTEREEATKTTIQIGQTWSQRGAVHGNSFCMNRKVSGRVVWKDSNEIKMVFHDCV